MLTIPIAGAGSAQQDTERVLARTVEFAPNGVALLSADGLILLTNTELQRMFGYAKTELLEQSIEQLMPERFKAGHAALRAAGGKDIQSTGAGRELLGRRADGTEFPIEIGLSILETSYGAMVLETIVDLSARERLERMFQKMVEAAPCGMVMIEPRGRIVLANQQLETMFGYARVELIGSPLEMLLPERFRTIHAGHRRAFAAAPAMRQMGVGADLTARRKDGSEFPVEIGLSPMPGEQGGLMLAAVSDISRRKSMELELRLANASIQEFRHTAVHDLKPPLRSISDLLEWIEEDLGTSASPEITRNLYRVCERIQHLDHLIGDLLNYSLAGTPSAEAVAVDPRTLLVEILETQPLPPTLRISLRVQATPFVTSKTALATALCNIIANALKRHDMGGGSLDVRAEEVDHYCVFTVSDDGPGIPFVEQERVFRVSHTLAPTGRGGAMNSLALSKRLVESHGGRITLSSTDGTRGASFRVWWPRRK
jgi:PAS domain S-box-containing protein